MNFFSSIRFTLDGEELMTVTPPEGGFWELGNFETEFPGIDNPWIGEDKMAPFNKEVTFQSFKLRSRCLAQLDYACLFSDTSGFRDHLRSFGFAVPHNYERCRRRDKRLFWRHLDSSKAMEQPVANRTKRFLVGEGSMAAELESRRGQWWRRCHEGDLSDWCRFVKCSFIVDFSSHWLNGIRMRWRIVLFSG